jgi:hypothetical protein
MASGDGVVRLAMWSGPRNISTALMRSWENRDDTVVVDEPLYAHYLSVTGLDHPAREEVIAAGETDWQRVVDDLLGPVPHGVRVFYQKHMTHHLLPDVDHGWIGALTNVMLIRDPREVVASYIKSRQTVSPEDLGLPQQVQLYEELAVGGVAPPVIDAADFLQRPEPYLRALCDLVDLPFSDAMLSWPAGPRDSDGVWAPYWYAAVWKSTGFEPYRRREVDFDEVAEGTAAAVQAAAGLVADKCMPLYEHLHVNRWVV